MPSEIDLVKLKAAIADIDENLEKLKANHSLTAGERLLKQHAYRRERRKLELRVKLFHQKRLIERLEGEARSQELFRMSPLGQAVAEWEQKTAESRAEKRRQKLLLLARRSAQADHSAHSDARRKMFSHPQIQIERQLHL